MGPKKIPSFSCQKDPIILWYTDSNGVIIDHWPKQYKYGVSDFEWRIKIRKKKKKKEKLSLNENFKGRLRILGTIGISKL